MFETKEGTVVNKSEILRRSLRKQIMSGGLEPGDKLPPERELAVDFGVSRLIVREALSDLAREGLLVRVQGSGTYVSERLPDDPLLLRPVTLLYPLRQGIDLSVDPYCMQLVSGINQVLSSAEQKQMLTLCPLKQGQDLSGAVPRNLWREELSGGLLLHPELMVGDEVKVLQDTGVDMVSLGRFENANGVSFVDADNVEGISLAMEHLFELGHEKIALISGSPDLHYCRDRRSGYQLKLRQHGLPDSNSLIVQASPWSRSESVQAVKSLLASGQKFTAVICCGDRATLGAIQTLREYGLRVPDDVSVVCYGDYPWIRDWVEPGITAIAQPVVDMGKEAALILQKLRVGDGGKVMRRLLSPRLVVRQSTSAVS